MIGKKSHFLLGELHTQIVTCVDGGIDAVLLNDVVDGIGICLKGRGDDREQVRGHPLWFAACFRNR